MVGTDLEDECGLGCSTFAAALPLLLCWQSPPLWVRSDWEGSCSACLAPRPTASSKAIMEGSGRSPARRGVAGAPAVEAEITRFNTRDPAPLVTAYDFGGAGSTTTVQK